MTLSSLLSSSIGAKPRWPARWAGIAWCTVPVVYALLLTAPSVTLPGDDLGLRRFQTPLLAPDLWLGQTFTMTTDGLYAIEVFATRIGARVSGDVRFELYDVTQDGELPPPRRLAVVGAADLVKGPSYRFEFPPILDSQDRSYLLNIVSSAMTPAEGLAFWATKGERYTGGSLRINDQDRWADMAFRAYAPAPAIWRLLVTLRATNPVRGDIAIAAFVAIWLLMGLVLRGMAAISDEPGPTDSDRPA